MGYSQWSIRRVNRLRFQGQKRQTFFSPSAYCQDRLAPNEYIRTPRVSWPTSGAFPNEFSERYINVFRKFSRASWIMKGLRHVYRFLSLFHVSWCSSIIISYEIHNKMVIVKWTVCYVYDGCRRIVAITKHDVRFILLRPLNGCFENVFCWIWQKKYS